ncbi:hypothetical protein [Novosphingobium sp. AAP83]|uniref:hypothetical protein n=1 Tax=Novosphingobium sp. AAP83 TaxID=1523425 RepID=UPI0006B97A64|nr:hypothetical protein [Novosphingobium sp. AAP83]
MRPRFAVGDYVALGSRIRPHAWAAWLDQRRDAPRPRTLALIDHHFLMVEPALGRPGVALSPKAIALNETRLEASCGFDADGTDYALICPISAAIAQDLCSLIDWIIALEPS